VYSEFSFLARPVCSQHFSEDSVQNVTQTTAEFQVVPTCNKFLQQSWWRLTSLLSVDHSTVFTRRRPWLLGGASLHSSGSHSAGLNSLTNTQTTLHYIKTFVGIANI